MHVTRAKSGTIRGRYVPAPGLPLAVEGWGSIVTEPINVPVPLDDFESEFDIPYKLKGTLSHKNKKHQYQRGPLHAGSTPEHQREGQFHSGPIE